MLVGLDLDNTIICYDNLFLKLLREQAWCKEQPDGKQELKNVVVALEDGQQKWEFLQWQAYGPRCSEASLSPGFIDFMAQGQQKNIKFCVISHKTVFAKQDLQKIHPLREIAMQTLEKWGLFCVPGLPLTKNDIHFADHRDEKLTMINKMACDVFVDDLYEVLDHPKFPLSTKPIWFSSQGNINTKLIPYPNWKSVWRCLE